jgi:predicted transcriptional regulator
MIKDTRPKRTIILSLRPEPFQAIVAGVKKYEYRRKFVKEGCSAFVYVTSPIKAIRGYIEFGEPISAHIQTIANISEQQKPGSREATLKYLQGLQTGFAVPILSYRTIQPLPLEELRTKYQFTAPQSYIYLDTRACLKEDLMNRLT